MQKTSIPRSKESFYGNGVRKNTNEGYMYEFTNVSFVGLVDVIIKCLPIRCWFG